MPAFCLTRFSGLLSAATLFTHAVAGLVLLSACASAPMTAEDSPSSKSATARAQTPICASKPMIIDNPDGTFTVQKWPPDRNSNGSQAKNGLVIPAQVVVPFVPAVGKKPQGRREAGGLCS